MIVVVLYVCLFIMCFMSLVWGLYILCRNAAIVDLAWSISIGGISNIYFFSSSFSFLDYFIYFLMMLWTARIVLLICYRLIKYKTDGRYDELDKKWAHALEFRYFIFFLSQGAAAIVMTAPLWFISFFCRWAVVSIFATIFMITGLVGVITADITLQRFIARKENKGEVCEKGLWGYSRHPNYFFELMYWLGLFMFALSTSWGWISIISPLCLFVAIFFITGIPPSEARSLLTKKEKYKDYQQRVSVFIPWFPKKKKVENG